MKQWQWEGGDGEGATGGGQRGGREEGARGEGISQMEMMKCLGGMKFSDFVYPCNARYPS